MNSLVLSTVTRLLAPLLLVFSIFVLLRGHNEPGGGFIGGLLAAIAFILINKAEGNGLLGITDLPAVWKPVSVRVVVYWIRIPPIWGL